MMQLKSEKIEPKTDSVTTKSVDYSQISSLIQTISTANLPATLVSKEVIAAVISVNNCSNLKYYRKHYWQEGAHYFFVSPKKIVYHLELITHWIIHNRLNPKAHQRAIEVFFAKLESARSTKNRRRKTR